MAKRQSKNTAQRTVRRGLSGILHMKPEEFDKYIRARISAKAPPPRIDDRAGEENEDILISGYRAGAKPFRLRMGAILKELCWQASGRNPEPVEFSRVLRMAEELRLKECMPHLLCLLAEKPKFFMSTPGYYKRDLLLHVMVALQQLQEPANPIVCWQKYLDDAHYAVPAYAGFLGLGADEAIEHLPAFLETVAEGMGAISARDALLHLFTRYRREDVVYRSFTRCRGEQARVRRLLLATAKSIASVSQEAEAHERVLFPRRGAASAPAPRRADVVKRIKAFQNFTLQPAIPGTRS